MNKLRNLRSNRALREVGLLLGMYWLYSSIRGFIAHSSPYLPFQNAMRIIALERHLGIFGELALQRWLLDRAVGVVRAANHFYTVGYFPVLVAMGVMLFFRDRERFDFFKRAFILGLGFALIGFLLFPLSPPRLLPGWGFVDTQQQMGMGILNHKSVLSFYNPYAAMPSLHFGWALLIGLMLGGFRWRICKVVGVLYPAVMAMTVIITGHHYWLDVAGGGIVVGAAFTLVRVLEYSAASKRPAMVSHRA